MEQKSKTAQWISIIFLLVFIFKDVAGAIEISQGWSEGIANPAQAVQKVTEMTKNEKPPSMIFVASTPDNDGNALVGAISAKFPTVPVWGATSAKGIFMNNTRYLTKNAVGLLFFSDTKNEYDFFVGGRSVDGGRWEIKATEIIKDAKKISADPPSMILLTCNPGPHEEKILELLIKTYGKSDIPIYGGSSGTTDNKAMPRFVIANGDAYKKGLAIAFIYTREPIGHYYPMGYKPLINERATITKSEGRTVQEINGKPAIDEYNRMAGGKFNNIIQLGKPLRGEGQMLAPLAKVVEEKGKERYISLSAKQYDPKSGAIEFFASVHPGDKVTVLKGNKDNLSKRVYLGVVRAKTALKDRLNGGLVFFCSGARLLLEREGRIDEVSHAGAQKGFKSKPYLIWFMNGEHGGPNIHGNLMSGIVTFQQ
ncbi:MAG: hypothetical protein GY795_37210 [Desulfobacterales bacterium]|nr:hypothetical protein [Desulfobacterales bacterium]